LYKAPASAYQRQLICCGGIDDVIQLFLTAVVFKNKM